MRGEEGCGARPVAEPSAVDAEPGLGVVDPEVDRIIRFEEERQEEKLILIPSESRTPAAVREVLGSAFVSLYAEGYPPERMLEEDEAGLGDHERHLAFYRRYADRRYYKGTEYVHFAEALARRRCAQCFSNERVAVDDIFVNVQPLSGAAANLAVYEAFLRPGDKVLAMDLSHGGHLSHGSGLHVSGRRYQVIPYQVDGRTGRLDYDRIVDLARVHRPSLVIAGYSSYPWAPDWEAFRRAADVCGARLMADVAHPAGMIAGGAFPSPVGCADVVTFTTHKTLCGPRGACVLTFDAHDAALVDTAVFPGLQGGPHVNSIAAMAVCFRIASSPEFARLQRRVVDNARALAEALREGGIAIAYGGTDTHLMVIDLKGLAAPGAEPLCGEPASRILDLAGLVANRNTLPEDPVSALATGVRVGSPWLTQRGLGIEDMARVAGWIARILKAIVPFRYIGRIGELPRGKIPLAVLEETRREVAGFVRQRCGFPRDGGPGEGRGPRIDVQERVGASRPVAGNAGTAVKGADRDEERGTGRVFDVSHLRFLRLRGERAVPMLQQVTTRDAAGLDPGQVQETFMLQGDGQLLDDVLLLRESPGEHGEPRFVLVLHPEHEDRKVAWLHGLSNGYLVFDPEDRYRKVEGPVVLELSAGFPSGDPRALAFTVGSSGEPACPPGLAEHAASLGPGSFRAVPAEAGGGMLCRPNRDLLFWFGPEEAMGILLRGCAERGLVPGDRDAWERERSRRGLPDHRAHRRVGGGACVERLSAGDLIDAGLAEWFVWDLPYFVGQGSLQDRRPSRCLPEFEWAQKGEERAAGRPAPTPLADRHVERKARMVDFAGWRMPVWFEGASREHAAVREAAGLFDTTHMGVLEVRGRDAEAFVDLVCSNYARWYPDGMSFYGYLLDPRGHVLDDVLVYRRSAACFMIVVNAANHAKVVAWLGAVNRGEVSLDVARRDLRLLRKVDLRVLSDPEAAGEDARVDLALQGPQSRTVLAAVLDGEPGRDALRRLGKGAFFETAIRGKPVLVARTGYTGEAFGYELFVHPRHAAELWDLLLEAGGGRVLRPAGLAARDSLRIEAGLPLYGHELAGPLDIGPVAAGFGPFVKLHKPFFVGRDPCVAEAMERSREVCRFRLAERGVRVPRPGDPVVSRRGKVVGHVTSCAAGSDGRLVGMACVERTIHVPGNRIGILFSPRGGTPSRAEGATPEIGDRVPIVEEAVVLHRFPTSEERHAWLSPGRQQMGGARS